MANTMSLAGKRVVAIGGSSGIGFAIAVLAREQGANVVIASSNQANVDAAVARLPGSSGSTVDLRDEADVSRFFDQVGGFDHLAITAGDQGLPAFGAARDLDLDVAREALALRFWGSLAAVKHGSRAIAPNGSITLTGGLLAHRPQKGTRVRDRGGGRHGESGPRPCRRSRAGARQRGVPRAHSHRTGQADAGRAGALLCGGPAAAARGRAGARPPPPMSV